MKKRAYLLHAWGAAPEGAFRPWLKAQLERRGYEVEMPAFPDADHPRIEAWVPLLASRIGVPDEDVVLVGHSLGGQTALRYLSGLEEGARIGAAVLVATPIVSIAQLDEEEQAIAAPWLADTIDYARVLRATKRLTAFFSDNDPWVPQENVLAARARLGDARVVVERAKGHYNVDDGVRTVPEVLNAILVA